MGTPLQSSSSTLDAHTRQHLTTLFEALSVSYGEATLMWAVSWQPSLRDCPLPSVVRRGLILQASLYSTATARVQPSLNTAFRLSMLCLLHADPHIRVRCV